MSAAAGEALDRTLAALADPNRRRAVDLLAAQPRAAGELARELGLATPRAPGRLAFEGGEGAAATS